MNNYCRLSHVKRRVEGLGSTDYDEQYVDLIDDVSRVFQGDTKRQFHSTVETVYLDGDGSRLLILPHGRLLISVDSLKVDDDDDGTYDITLVDGTDYRLVPTDQDQKYGIELLTQGTQIHHWPRYQSSVELTGKFGWSEESDDTGLTGTVADATTETLTASADPSSDVERADTLLVGDEQMEVTAAVSNTAISVKRGINGTTATSHSGEAIKVRRFPRDVEQAVARRVIADRWDNNTGDILGEVGKGFSVSYAKYRNVVDRYRMVVFA